MRTFLSYLGGLVLGVVLIAFVIYGLPGSSRNTDEAVNASVVSAVGEREGGGRATSSGHSDVSPERDHGAISAVVTTDRHNAITRAVEAISPSVVGINVITVREIVQRDPFFSDPFFRGLFPERHWRQKVENLGSGFIISPDGYIMTNEHVVHEATRIIVTTTTQKKYEAEIVGFDFNSDVALLKIEGDNFPYIRFGNSDSVIIGEWVIALGNPFGLFEIHSQPSVTVGVVSAVDRDFDTTAVGRLYQDMIQTDAAINQGNSGGPLVNSLGEIIGMNTMIFSQSGGSVGVGFAIPSNRLRTLYEELRAREEISKDFWIGLHIQNINWRIAVVYRLREVRGVIVTEVEPGSPAAKAGIEPAYIILGVNGDRINNAADITRILAKSDLRVGDEITLTIFDGRRVADVSVKLGKKG